MKTNPILTVIVLTTTLVTTTGFGEVATPSTPAPAVQEAAPAPVINPTPAPNQVIYLPQLPSATALANAAAAQGVAVEQINQTSNQITVVYKYSNGQTNTICYQLLSAVAAAPVPAGAAPVVVAAPAQPTVVYGEPAPVYYYDPFYNPWPWFAPVSIDLGFGFHGYRHWGGHYWGGHGWGGHWHR